MLILSVLPHQSLNVPRDKTSEVIEILKDTRYYNNPTISSITFTTTREVTRICEMSEGHTAIGCTQPHPLYGHTFDISVSNEDSDWRNTLYHEIAHVECDTESCANTFMNSKKR